MADHQALLIVEGGNDHSCLRPVLHPHCHVVDANGRPNVEEAIRTVGIEAPKKVVFLIDCDGGVEDALKGGKNLIITRNRDLDADLVFELGAWGRVADNRLAGKVDPEELADRSARLLQVAELNACHFGIVLEAARATGQKVRIKVSGYPGTRRVSLIDLKDAELLLRKGVDVTLDDIVDALADRMGWSAQGVSDIKTTLVELESTICSCGSGGRCAACHRMKYVHGHELVSNLSAALELFYGVETPPWELQRMLHLSIDWRRVKNWVVTERLKEWQEDSRRQVVA